MPRRLVTSARPFHGPRSARRAFPPALADAFTLIELLVVIAIIALLISLLFPVLAKARRKAVVLASPVAYVGADNRVYLTGAQGGSSLSMAATFNRPGCPVCHAPPVWSPSGSELAFTTDDGTARALHVLTPLTGRTRKVAADAFAFLGWSANSDRVVESNKSHLRTRHVDTGIVSDPLDNNRIVCMAPAPPSAPAPYIGVTLHLKTASVTFLRRDFVPTRRVWSQRGVTGTLEFPRCDPTGEYVAWTQPHSNGRDRVMAFKHVSDSPETPPTVVGQEFRSIYFCDWTAHGHLLGNATSDGTHFFLVIFDRKGRLVRRLDLETPPARGVIASYRRYGHQ